MSTYLAIALKANGRDSYTHTLQTAEHAGGSDGFADERAGMNKMAGDFEDYNM